MPLITIENLTSSYIGLFVSLDKAPNSTTNVPAPAVQVTEVSPGGTPCLKLIVPYGRPRKNKLD